MIIGKAKTSAGVRIYAIGDVHGCVKQLRQLMKLIEKDLAVSPVEKHKIIFLGDYVDRGPQNRQVIDVLIGLKKSSHKCIFLRGNHDDRFAGFMKLPEQAATGFLRWGGIATLRDYGIVQKPGESVERLSVRLSEAIPKLHLRFFEKLKYFHQDGDYFFCHAGVRPGVSLAKQQAQDLMWIRTDFLAHKKPFEKVIVHGHTPVGVPEIEQNRINVDTRCYDSGVLTAVVLEGKQHRILNT
ncbi:MAG: metallophosphoesterase family protein [Rhizobiaceae bacterium]